MKRRFISTRARKKVFERHNRICHLCGNPIVFPQPWEVSHATPLEMGGADDETNWFPAHADCHKYRTAKVDIPMIARAKRVEAKHLGAKAPSRNPIRGWRKFNGDLVWAEDKRR